MFDLMNLSNKSLQHIYYVNVKQMVSLQHLQER